MRKEYKINHTKAWCYFVASGAIPADAKKNEWVLHHVDIHMKSTDAKRYNEWRIEDLVPMTRVAHTQLHAGNRTLSEKTKEKISAALTGHVVSDETRSKISAKCKGLHLGKEFKKGHIPWNAGAKMDEEYCRNVAKARIGKLLWNNGVTYIHAAECPGPEWKRGRIKHI